MSGYGTLYLVATPIGNMEDITLRAIRTLKEADLSAAEDTRQTIKLLNRYEIKTPMTSYHGHSADSKSEYIIDLLKEGKNIALVSDAGTPGISDPGEEIVFRAAQEGIKVSPIPGASAVISALIVSSFRTGRFAFEGFLPKNKSDKRERLELLKTEARTTVFYESPHKLIETLELMDEIFEHRRITLARELTKKFEEIWTGTASEAIQKYQSENAKGEFVIVVEGVDAEQLKNDITSQWKKMPMEQHYGMYLKEGMNPKEAMKKVANDRGMQKREVYKIINTEN